MSAHTQWLADELVAREKRNGVPCVVLTVSQWDRIQDERVAAQEMLAALKELVAALDERDIRMMATTRCRQAIAAAERRSV